MASFGINRHDTPALEDHRAERRRLRPVAQGSRIGSPRRDDAPGCSGEREVIMRAGSVVLLIWLIIGANPKVTCH
jgi:hypothetical protein